MPMLEELGGALTAPTAPFDTSYGALGVDVFLSLLPDAPDTAIALMEIAGGRPIETMTPLPNVTQQTLQVLVRDPSFAVAQSLAGTLWLDLHRVLEVDLSGTRWHGVSATQSPYLMERDEHRRNIFTCTYSVMRKVQGS